MPRNIRHYLSSLQLLFRMADMIALRHEASILGRFARTIIGAFLPEFF
jgi:hypothetical protein